MRRMFRRCQILLVCICVLFPPAIHATNGYFLIGYGAKSRGMGGTGITNPTDALAAGANPAGMSRVGTRIDFGVEVFNPPREVAAANGEFDFQTPNKESKDVRIQKSGSNLFAIPSFGANYKFNRKITVGMSVIGAGANTRYNENFFQLTGVPPNEPYGTLGIDYVQMQMLPTATYKLNKQHALGMSLVFGAHRFRAYGLGNFGTCGSDADFQLSSDDCNLTNRGNDYAYGGGVRFGWLGSFFDKKVDLGAYWASKIYMTDLDKYSGLFPNGGNFDQPEHFGLGLAIHPSKKLTIAADIQRIKFTTSPGLKNPHSTQSLQDPCTRPIDFSGPCQPGNKPVPSSKALGAEDGMGFGWDDQYVYKIGASYQFNRNWIVRAGFNYGESPIPDNQLLFGLVAPAITEKHVTAGFTYMPDNNSEWTVSFVHAIEETQTCEVRDGCTTMLTQSEDAYVAAKMKIYALGVSYGYHF